MERFHSNFGFVHNLGTPTTYVKIEKIGDVRATNLPKIGWFGMELPNFFRKWWCLLHLTLYEDVYKVFVKHTLVGNSKTKALVTIIALNDGKCQYFY